MSASTTSSLTRRQLVALTGAAGLAAAAATAGIAGADEAGIGTTTSPAGTPSFLTKPEPIDEAQVVATHDYEIVVVGAGASGTSAAISAFNSGAKVCVVQKDTVAISQGNEAACVGLADSTEAAIQHLIDLHIEENAYRPVRSVVNTWAHHSEEAFNTLVEFSKDAEYPLVFTDEPVDYPYADTDQIARVRKLVPDGTSYANGIFSLAQAAEAAGVEFFYGMPGVQLAQQDGRVTGVYCLNADGAYELFNASKGVILCCGDYENNDEMVAYYCPDVYNTRKIQFGKTGDGDCMGMWAGGVMEPVCHSKMMHSFGSGPMANEHFLIVNMRGQRICAEEVQMVNVQNFTRFEELSGQFCQIFDSNYEEQVTGWGGTPTPKDKFPPYMPASEEYNNRGELYSADTLEELAEQLEIQDVEAFVATVERYNEIVAAGVDEDFGKSPIYLAPIDTPPFYGIHRDAGVSAITAGLLTDADQRVVDASWNPIPGLYAAGNNAGGFFGGVDYPMAIEGISIGRALTGGYVAAETAIKDAEAK